MATLVFRTDAPLVKGPPQGHWAYEDWEALPDDGNRYEIIDGTLYMTTAPSLFHQWVVHMLIGYIGFPAAQQKLAYAYTAPVGVLMPGCDPVQPDFVVVKADRTHLLEDGKRIMGVPDLIVEILSPGNRAYDETIKLPAYANAGVPEVGIIDPDQRQLRLYQLDVPGQFLPPVIYDESDMAHFGCLPTISFRVRALFEGGPPLLS